MSPVDQLSEYLEETMGAWFVLVSVLVAVIMPMAIIFVTVYSRMHGRRGVRAAIVVGLSVTLWVKACAVFVPYLGTYPNLPSILLSVVFKKTYGEPLASLVFLCADFPLWILVGVAIYGVTRRRS